jgi:DNA-binding CsgD family transcriptional regulator
VTNLSIAAAHLLGAADAFDARTPFAVVAAARDHDVVDLCLAGLEDAFAAVALDAQRRAGAGFTVEQSVALAREVARIVLSANHVDRIWQAASAPDPGPVPKLPTALHLVPSPAASDVGAYSTIREREVLTLLCQRLTDPEIAAHLFFSLRTPNRHVSNILSKLDAPNRREAAAIAARSGLV